jgi:very-short-patch-repair endonuclease
MTKTELHLLLSKATDEISKQILADEIRKIEFNEKKRVKRDEKKESALTKIVEARRAKLYNVLSKFREENIEKQTAQEKRIKALLKSLNITYEFQKIFMDGHNGYIPDFYLPYYNLVIEVDGWQHYTISGKLKDKKRTKELIKYSKIKGVIRLTNKSAEVIQNEELKNLIINFVPNPEFIQKPAWIPQFPKEKSKKKVFELPQKQIDKMTNKGKKSYLKIRKGTNK